MSLSNYWNLRMTPPSLGSSLIGMSLPIGGRLTIVTWCIQHKLELNTVKNVEMVIDSAPPASIILCNSPVETVDSVRFLGTVINQDFKWKLNISSLIKKAQQRMYFLKKFNLPKTMMVHFYTSIIESILTSSITIWCAASTAKDKGRLNVLCALLRRLLDETFHLFRTFLFTTFWCTPIWQKAAGHQKKFFSIRFVINNTQDTSGFLTHAHGHYTLQLETHRRL